VVDVAQARAPADRGEIKARLRDLPPGEFVNHYILDCVPWIFPSRRRYVDWKSQLAEGLEVDPYAILVVGSSCVGLSLAPHKDLRPFHEASDIDVAIVSSHHFDIAWRWLRSIGPIQSFKLDPYVRKMFQWHRKNLIFDGAIAAERILNYLPFGAQWTSALSAASAADPVDSRVVKARIYRDFESLRSYHEKNIRDLSTKMLDQDSDSLHEHFGSEGEGTLNEG
jgi:hypothetical protein